MLAIIVLARLAVFSSAEKRFLVYPTILQERTTASNFILQLTDDIILNLKKSDVLAAKLLMATSRQEDSQIEEIDTSALQEHLYHDEHHQSSVIVNIRNRTAQVEGIINSKLRIMPLPKGNLSLRGEMLHLLYEAEEKRECFINFGK
ncbi:uncharacterized protein LOC142563349 [Dermacentor variabilis]|uniref:uncharacterized protein LOC142563349 n=1 Tax=Dermacentor variabilis TaxID=34621 RepID=UPI003F5BFB33